MKGSLRPRFQWPALGLRRPLDLAAFWAGTGLGSGLLRPFSATWGSLAGMPTLWLWAKVHSWPARLAAGFLGLTAAIWAADRCEVLFGVKDPKSVVIDEIAPLPIAFWPLCDAGEARWWVWVAAFCLYRVADLAKPWPARRCERWPGGFGIVADDLVSALYTGAILRFAERYLPG